MDKIKEVKKWMDDAKHLVFFGGAGTSTASGIPDFRSENGVYHKEREDKLPPEFILSHTYLKQDPDGFSKSYKKEYVFPDKEPNKLHYILTELEEKGVLQAIITQNIDGLHQKAGSKNVLEIHGNMVDHYCVDCGKKFPLEYALAFEKSATCDECCGFVRPDVVLYEEMLPQGVFEEAIRQVRQADVMIVAGTSLVVYPAAGLLQYYRGNRLILINKQVTQMDSMANAVFHDDIGDILEKITETNHEN